MSSRKKGNTPGQSPEIENAEAENLPPEDAARTEPDATIEDAEIVETVEATDAPDGQAEPLELTPDAFADAPVEEVSPEPAESADADTPDDGIVVPPVMGDPGAVEAEFSDEDLAAEDREVTAEEGRDAIDAAVEDTTDVPPDGTEPKAPEVAAPAPSPAPAEAKSSGGGFMPAVLGGLVAAGLGFGAAIYLGGTGSGEVEESLDAQARQLSGLEARIGEIAAAVADDGGSAVETQLSGLTEQLQTQFGDVATRLDAVVSTVGGVESQLGASISAVQEKLSDLDTRLAAVNDRLTAVEKRPLQESSEAAKAAFAAYERELEDLKTTLGDAQSLNNQVSAEMEARAAAAQAEMDAVAAKAEALQAEADAKAEAAAVREALASLDGAVERGTGYATALAVLSGATEVPETLNAYADSGVASLPELRRRYPESARDALDASIRETVSDDTMGRLTAFLRAQTGARSLEPHEGDDPDAVLSRAEAALAAGDLETTLSELAQLPPAGQAAMADWAADAKARLDVTQATAGLAQTLLAN
ncbi:MAG: hypothetical protein KDA50_08095 [Rhodobacteraceae bacterium]|nr:hypothetical protein [Paracoccaceae bacterium]